MRQYTASMETGFVAWERPEIFLAAADNREDSQLITLDRDLVQGAVAGIDHGNADFFRVDTLEVNNLPHRDRGRKGLLLLLKSVFPEKGEQLDRDQYFVVCHP